MKITLEALSRILNNKREVIYGDVGKLVLALRRLFKFGSPISDDMLAEEE